MLERIRSVCWRTFPTTSDGSVRCVRIPLALAAGIFLARRLVAELQLKVPSDAIFFPARK